MDMRVNTYVSLAYTGTAAHGTLYKDRQIDGTFFGVYQIHIEKISISE